MTKKKEIKSDKINDFVVVMLLMLGVFIMVALGVYAVQQYFFPTDNTQIVNQTNTTGYCVDNCIDRYMENRTVNNCIEQINVTFFEICDNASVSPLNCSQGQQALEEYIIPFCIEFTDEYLYNVSIACTQECYNNES